MRMRGPLSGPAGIAQVSRRSLVSPAVRPASHAYGRAANADAFIERIAGGLMLLLPGYFSDLIGILLLLPPVRSAIYAFLKTRIQVVSPVFSQPRDTSPPQGTIDLDETDYRRR